MMSVFFGVLASERGRYIPPHARNSGGPRPQENINDVNADPRAGGYGTLILINLSGSIKRRQAISKVCI